jgi:hypothetical protein
LAIRSDQTGSDDHAIADGLELSGRRRARARTLSYWPTAAAPSAPWRRLGTSWPRSALGQDRVGAGLKIELGAGCRTSMSTPWRRRWYGLFQTPQDKDWSRFLSQFGVYIIISPWPPFIRWLSLALAYSMRRASGLHEVPECELHRLIRHRLPNSAIQSASQRRCLA